jgi:hypothetical protein
VFGYKNHIGIDREFGFYAATPSPMRRCMMAANSARCSTATIPPTRADTAYRTKANQRFLAGRALRS